MKIRNNKKNDTTIVELDRVEAFNLIENLLATLKQTEISDSFHSINDYKNNKELLITISK